MTSVLVARNVAQKLGKTIIQISSPTLTGSKITIYTCPTGKTARVKGHMSCRDTGAGTTSDILFNGQSYAEWQATGGQFNSLALQDLAEEAQIQFDEVLLSGQLVELSQNSGTNSNFIGRLEIEERPV